MTLPKETIDAIEKGASVKTKAKESEIKDRFYKHSPNKIAFLDGYESGLIDGATEWAGRAHQPLIDLLDEARIQIEYLHKKFGETGSGNNVLARIETELAKYKEVGNG
jgi:hypothetical protein